MSLFQHHIHKRVCIHDFLSYQNDSPDIQRQSKSCIQKLYPENFLVRLIGAQKRANSRKFIFVRLKFTIFISRISHKVLFSISNIRFFFFQTKFAPNIIFLKNRWRKFRKIRRHINIIWLILNSSLFFFSGFWLLSYWKKIDMLSFLSKASSINVRCTKSESTSQR